MAEIALFNYYTAVAQDLAFKRRFLEMAGISLGVAVVSFLIGLLVKAWLGSTCKQRLCSHNIQHRAEGQLPRGHPVENLPR